MSTVKDERQNVAEKYAALDPSDKVLFETVLNLTVILLQGMQQLKKKQPLK